MVGLVRWLKGYVCFRICGGAPEKFLNAAAASVQLWHIYGTVQGITACCKAADYRFAAEIARECGARLQILRKAGLPFVELRLRRRPGAAVGVLLFFGLQVLLSGFVWQIEVTGADKMNPADILRAAEHIGLYEGMPQHRVQVQAAQHALLRTVPELAWAAVNKTGCRLEISIRERVTRPEILPDQPCNLVARIGGVILRTQAEDGFAVVSAGDAVEPGDLLVEGLREDAYQGTVMHHAHGPVYAVTSHTFEAVQSMVYADETDTGEIIVRRRCRIFGLELPLSLTEAPETGWYRQIRAEPVMLWGVRLPITLYTEEWNHRIALQRQCTEEEATALARAQITAQVQAQLPEAQILSIAEEVWTQGGTVRVVRTLTCVENIAVQIPIEIVKDGTNW